MAAKSLHAFMLYAMFRAPLMFYEQTPIGRVLSRFSKDLDSLDTTLPELISDGIYCFFEVTNTTNNLHSYFFWLIMLIFFVHHLPLRCSKCWRLARLYLLMLLQCYRRVSCKYKLTKCDSRTVLDVYILKIELIMSFCVQMVKKFPFFSLHLPSIAKNQFFLHEQQSWLDLNGCEREKKVS